MIKDPHFWTQVSLVEIAARERAEYRNPNRRVRSAASLRPQTALPRYKFEDGYLPDELAFGAGAGYFRIGQPNPLFNNSGGVRACMGVSSVDPMHEWDWSFSKRSRVVDPAASLLQRRKESNAKPRVLIARRDPSTNGARRRRPRSASAG
mmetsp:Transcript_2013/g.4581  ORF Transcript_2013/g.4581 Transcript_2013/m.4581 type:complete len:150 (-) Transcript_2013:89-538(-)|eukprot:CAMPEP_0204260496 /NCGR_PEP_ID=MMETSP0468-20130131/6381_1 /ASSEMBLY_ACC=CAM_ASM_000383 /TAXON_ID=2969 /ORGANISM="Oxyrrhis marina" /LENGTH=149 /DNA_ID=CAMNT_0051234937 /DNA_START=22 /DNA_END=471 /DNA_ORIENTATION=-